MPGNLSRWIDAEWLVDCPVCHPGNYCLDWPRDHYLGMADMTKLILALTITAGIVYGACWLAGWELERHGGLAV